MAGAERRWPYPVPGRITVALDAKALDGPEVDEACGVAEPVVDLWEAGVLIPTDEQLAALAKLTEMPVSFFYGSDSVRLGPVFVCSRGRRKHGLSVVRDERPSVICQTCLEPAWMAMPSADGMQLVDGPHPAGGLVVALVGRGAKSVWGVRPVHHGELVDPSKRRIRHYCPDLKHSCCFPGCGDPAKMYPNGAWCRRHAPNTATAPRR